MKSLNELKVKELKDICRNYEISGYSGLRKAELVSLIVKSLSEKNIKDILKQKGILKEDIPSREEIKEEIASDRKIDNRRYLNYLLQSLNVKELKQLCRDFLLKGYSGLKKADLIEFILDSLSEEEYKRVIYNKELEIISEGIELALKKIQGKDRETIKEINIVNPDLNEIELYFKGFNWEVSTFLSITEDNIENPDRDCDCRIGANMGFCSHFWVGFIFSLKQGFFKLEDWHLTRLPENFEEQVKSIQIYGTPSEEKKEEEEGELTLIDGDSDDAILLKYLDSRVTVYKGEITNIERVESEFQQYITIYYLIDLKNVELGPQIKAKKDFDEKKLQSLEKLKVRLSENKYDKVKIKEGDNFGCNGTVNRDTFHGYYLLQRVSKPTTNPKKPS
jgi:hypothetical protein